MSQNLVRQWMTSDPVIVLPSTPIRDAYWLMVDHKVHRLPVMDKGRLVGIITLEDLRRAEPPTGIGLDLVRITDMLSKMAVQQVMTRNPKTISPEAPLIEAAQMMLENEISALPVLEGAHLVGIIAVSDIFRAYVELEQKKQYATT
jgi:acetoin utilization protein AcuB